MNQMTCNKLITLLTIYRGTYKREDSCNLGTLDDDLAWLYKHKLIESVVNSDGITLAATEIGRSQIEDILSLPWGP